MKIEQKFSNVLILHRKSQLYHSEYPKSMKKVSLFVLLLAMVVSLKVKAEVSSGTGKDVPVSFQTLVLKKILMADQSIASRANGIIIVVYDETTDAQSEMIMKALGYQGLRAERTTSLSEMDGKNINAIYYVTDNVVRPAYIIENEILTFASNPDLVIQGKAAVSIRYKDNKPEIVINRSVLEAEGHGDVLNSIPKAAIY